MVKHEPELHNSAVTAKFANEPLTKMIKARLLNLQPGPD